ncbi:CDP-alcohol phosphatidyltransferase family protein [Enterococcus casseliflavus]|uniref:CDP-alcohol phosphatidyltransferase family protein n=1 Tax=Enterococcus TaxID=1350 RepID=UPI0009BE6908|nr:CDP-alcohol phosphatidyltransferase family protein [Enterococcus casseliflavus]MBE9900048.1 CDP-alcohol phosphatidyltransferase family protein [Enterococcus casseliflavus]MBE9903334.1 CDP-alcohol phosphatidyltransferase family protein [Enterococcus casseliflavus]MBE9923689.1 CDP-alcohol phosphatidyltransferase family protein [Enterococcus casseliflavus]MBO6357014.1 CDP-alcohol phosphatidyltransferase family protein [Enterococcus casseliflavus]MBO6377251.1 CDP-alcohol phosphatidyltransferase
MQGEQMNHLPNILTTTRLILAPLLLFLQPMSGWFWLLYSYCFVSDLVDGLLARRLNLTSEVGALLDSFADVSFFLAVFLSFLPQLLAVHTLWVWLLVIAMIRFVSYLIGYVKYRSFSSLHTWLNKAVGFLLCIFPLLLIMFHEKIVILILGTIATVSALEELLITILSKNLDRNQKSIFESFK